MLLAVCATILGAAVMGDAILAARKSTSPRIASTTSAVLRVPADHATLAAAVALANDGDVVEVSAGRFSASVTIHKQITLRGVDPQSTVLTAEQGPLELAGHVNVESLSVRGGKVGILVSSGADVTLQSVHVGACTEAGLLAESGERASKLLMHRCRFERNHDGVVLRGGRAAIIECEFVGQGDDAVDLNGDSQMFVYHSRLLESKGGGIEIRPGRTTYAVVAQTQIKQAGADGVTIVGGPTNANRNVFIVAGNHIEDCGRFGIGAVDDKTESDGSVAAAGRFWGSANAMSNCAGGATSPNLAGVNLDRLPPAEPIAAVCLRLEGTEIANVPVQFLTPLAVYGVAGVRDAESIALQPGISAPWAWITDDRLHRIWKCDLATGQTLDEFSVEKMFPGTGFRHPEGVFIQRDPDGTSTMLISDDDARMIAVVDLTGDRFKPIETFSTMPWHESPEDLCVVGDTLYVVGDRQLTAVNLGTRQVLPQFPVRHRPAGYATHAAGVAFDGATLLVTTTTGGEENPGALLQVDPTSGSLLAVWSLGEYVRDPRGVTVHNGLIFVVDGNPPDAQHRVWCFTQTTREDMASCAGDLLLGRTF